MLERQAQEYFQSPSRMNVHPDVFYWGGRADAFVMLPFYKL